MDLQLYNVKGTRNTCTTISSAIVSEVPGIKPQGQVLVTVRNVFATTQYWNIFPRLVKPI